jgi:uncharacterized protein
VAEGNLAAFLATLSSSGLGADHVVWGITDQRWQIEPLRRLEIPEDMQKRFGFRPLGAADGPVETAILGQNSACPYDYKALAKWLKMDRFNRGRRAA